MTQAARQSADPRIEAPHNTAQRGMMSGDGMASSSGGDAPSDALSIEACRMDRNLGSDRSETRQAHDGRVGSVDVQLLIAEAQSVTRSQLRPTNPFAVEHRAIRRP